MQFSKQFTRLDLNADAIDEYVEMTVAQRGNRMQFIHATDSDRRLIKVAVSDSVVALVEPRTETLQLWNSSRGH